MTDTIVHVTDASFEADVLQSDYANPGRFLGALVWSLQNDCSYSR